MKFKNQVILKPGIWNNFYYSEEALEKMKISEPVIVTDSFKSGVQDILGLATNFRWKNKEWLADIEIFKQIPEAILKRLEIAPRIKGRIKKKNMEDIELDEIALVRKSTIPGNEMR